MDIRNLMQKMTFANSELERECIKNKIESMFFLLSYSEKEAVRKDFLTDLYEKIDEGKKLLHRIYIYLEEALVKTA